MTVDYEHHERQMFRASIECEDDEYPILIQMMAEAGIHVEVEDEQPDNLR